MVVWYVILEARLVLLILGCVSLESSCEFGLVNYCIEERCTVADFLELLKWTTKIKCLFVWLWASTSGSALRIESEQRFNVFVRAFYRLQD